MNIYYADSHKLNELELFQWIYLLCVSEFWLSDI